MSYRRHCGTNDPQVAFMVTEFSKLDQGALMDRLLSASAHLSVYLVNMMPRPGDKIADEESNQNYAEAHRRYTALWQVVNDRLSSAPRSDVNPFDPRWTPL